MAPTLPTLFAVTLALRDVTGKPVALVDLFHGTEDVALNDSVTVSLKSLRAALSGKPVRPGKTVQVAASLAVSAGADVKAVVHASPVDVLVVVDPVPLLSESDSRLLKNMGAEPSSAFAAMTELWGRPLSAERDARAGTGANAQRKGQITRQLKAELSTALTEKSDSGVKGAKRGNR